MSEDSLAIDLKNVHKSFGKGSQALHVLKNVQFQAHFGEMTMLVGPSGCGKTTLLSIMAGTLRADQGELNVLGHSLEKQSMATLTRFRASNIGFIFQQFNLIPTISIAENVAVPLLINGWTYGKALAQGKKILERVGLGDRTSARPNQLSGGQQQRVAIARALVHDPRLVICDEPTAALDAKNGEIVLDLFREISNSKDRAVVIVTHDNRIFPYANRIATMDDGEVVDVRMQSHETPPQFLHH